MLRPKLLFILPLVMMLSSCSTRIMYNYVDWYIAWSVDDYVELTKEQEVLFEQRLEALISWHRQKQLPLYVDSLKRFRQAVVTNDRQLIKDNFNASMNLLELTVSKVAPEIVSLAELLSPEQKQQLLENIKEKQQDDHERWLEQRAESSEEDKLERNIEQSEKWFGGLNQQQKDLQVTLLHNLQDTMQVRISSRQNWTRLLTEALNIKQQGVDQLLLGELLTDMSSYRDADHVAKTEHNRQQFQIWLLTMLESLTSTQQAHFIDKIDDYIEDFEYLSEA